MSYVGEFANITATIWICYNFQIQKRIVSTETIRRNTVVHQHHILATVPLTNTLSEPEPLIQVELLSSDNEQDVYTFLALQIRFEAKSKKNIDKM